MPKKSSGAANHLHRYKKVNLSQDKNKPYFVYKCTKACTHYIAVALAEGVLCECNRCHQPMMIGKLQLYGTNGRAMTLPHCQSCVRPRKKKDTEDDVAAISQFFERNEI